MSHVWMGNGTHRNESCHRYEWAMSLSYCHAYESVISHIWMCGYVCRWANFHKDTFEQFPRQARHHWHVSMMWDMCQWCVTSLIHISYHICVNDVWHHSFTCRITYVSMMCDITHSHIVSHMWDMCQWCVICDTICEHIHTCEWVISHKSYHTCEWVISLIHICDTCDITHSHMWSHHSFTYVITYVWYDSFTYVIRLICMRDMTHLYAWHDSFIRVTCVIYTRDTQPNVWHDSFIRVTRLIQMCDMTHSYVCHDIHTCDVTHTHQVP